MRIASGVLIGDRPFFLDPLYPYFIAAIYALAGHSYLAVGIVQALLGALVPPLLYWAARCWFEEPVPLLAGLMALVYLPSIFFGGILMKPGLSLFLVTAGLGLLSRALAGGGRGTWLAAGVVFGLAALTRGNLVLVLPIVLAWIALRKPLEGRPAAGARWGEALPFAIGVALMLSLSAMHNYAAAGEFILTTANGGQNFFIGNNPTNHTGEYQELPFVDPNPKYEQRDFEREAERRAGRELTDREISRFWFAEAWRWVRAHPGDWVGLEWRKLRSYWGAYEIPDSLNYYLYSEYAPLLRLPLPGFGLVGPLGLAGAALALRRRGWPRLLLIFTAAYTLSTILFFVFSRFRMVGMPVLFVLASFAAVELVRRWRAALARREGFGPALAASALFLVFFVFVNVPVRAVADSRGYRLASALGVPTQLETTGPAHFNLGVVWAALAKNAADPGPLLHQAEDELREAIRLDPRYSKFFVELGKVLAREERTAEAIETYQRAAVMEPQDWRIQHSLGLLYKRSADRAAAEAAFRRAFDLAPRQTASADELGRLLLESGRKAEAAHFFRQALDVKPDDRAAREGLAAASTEPVDE